MEIGGEYVGVVSATADYTIGKTDWIDWLIAFFTSTRGNSGAIVIRESLRATPRSCLCSHARRAGSSPPGSCSSTLSTRINSSSI